MFFLHFLYFMDNFYKFLRFYVKIQNIETSIQLIFSQKPSESQLQKIFYKAP